MSWQRDISEKQFLAALTSHGMKFTGCKDYVNLGVQGRCFRAVALGKSRRAKLAYLLAAKESALVQAEADRASDAAIATESRGRELGEECSICHALAVGWDNMRDFVRCQSCGAQRIGDVMQKAERRSVPRTPLPPISTDDIT